MDGEGGGSGYESEQAVGCEQTAKRSPDDGAEEEQWIAHELAEPDGCVDASVSGGAVQSKQAVVVESTVKRSPDKGREEQRPTCELVTTGRYAATRSGGAVQSEQAVVVESTAKRPRASTDSGGGEEQRSTHEPAKTGGSAAGTGR